VLRRLGYLVSAHTDAADALEDFEARPDAIDIVVTDLTMPHMTGLDVIRRLRRLRPDVPVVLMSGFIGEEDLATARVLRVSAVVDKPLTVDTLATEIDRCLAEAVAARRASQS
jgi:CheY-like chemotaxis protein